MAWRRGTRLGRPQPAAPTAGHAPTHAGEPPARPRAPDAQSPAARGRGAPTLRAVVLALTLVVAISFGTSYVEFVVLGTQVGSFAPSGNALLPLLALALIVAPALRWLRPRWALEQRELVGVYVVLLAVASYASCQFAQWVVPVATGARYYATPYNGWRELLSLVPQWWGPADAEDVRRFYEGLRTGEDVRWGVWWRPLLAFGPFVLTLGFTTVCVLALLRRSWVEHERLPFPLVQLPLAITAPSSEHGGFLRSRLTWLGASIPLGVHSLNGLHFIIPTIPTIPVRDIGQVGAYLSAPPWYGAQPLWFDIYFCLVGFAFLSARDVPLSMWVFFLVYKAECVLGARWGWTPGGEDRSLVGDSFPLVEAQHVGALLAMVTITLWTARRHLTNAAGRALGRRRDVDDRDEPIGYRAAVIGAIAGYAGLVAWCTAAGLPVWASAAAMAVSLLCIVGVHRMMAEGGVNFLWAAQSGPNYLFHSLGAGQWLSPRAWLLLLSLPYFAWNFKGPVGPQAMEGFRLLADTGVRPRSVMWLGAAAVVLTAVLSYWSVIYLVHTHGGGAALDGYRFIHVGQRPFMELQDVTTRRAALSAPKTLTILASGLATWGIGWMRWVFPWWRLHPLGYAVSTMWAMGFMWFSMFLGSGASWLVTRAGGLALYRRSRPFFLGLVLGDFTAMGVWTAIDAVLGVRGFIILGH